MPDMPRGFAVFEGSGSAPTVDGLFRAQVGLIPDRTAVVAGTRVLSYRGLDERVGCLAGWLANEGVGRGDRIAVLSENRLEYIELQLAAARLGAIVACQNWRLAPEELAYTLALVEPTAVFTSERHAGLLAGPGRAPDRTFVFGQAFETALAASTAPPSKAIDAEDGLVILYTSRTTGLPKGAVISQRAIIARAKTGLIDGLLEAGTTMIAWAPMFHMISTDNILATLMTGGKVVLLDGFDPAAIAAILPHEEIGWLQVLPGTVERLIEAIRDTGARPKRIGRVGCMADLVPRHQIAELTGLLGAPYLNSFGSTETGSSPGSAGTVPVGVVAETLAKTLNSLCEIRLLDPEGADVLDGEAGELAFRGPTLFSFYWGRPAGQDIRDGWFHMGDVFRRNTDGSYDFVDRRKYLIKSGGENIYPAEIERVLLASSRISEAAVVRRTDARWGEVPVAFVVRANEGLTAEDVIALCRGRIASYKLPKAVRFVTEADLPRSSTGKIKRHELEAMLAQEDPAP